MSNETTALRLKDPHNERPHAAEPDRRETGDATGLPCIDIRLGDSSKAARPVVIANNEGGGSPLLERIAHLSGGSPTGPMPSIAVLSGFSASPPLETTTSRYWLSARNLDTSRSAAWTTI